MNPATGKAYAFDEGQVVLLMTIGNQITLAVHNAGLYEDLNERVESLQEKNESLTF